MPHSRIHVFFWIKRVPQIQLARSFMVGDRWRDIGAGKAAGCTTILVNRFPEATQIQPDIELNDSSDKSREIESTEKSIQS